VEQLRHRTDHAIEYPRRPDFGSSWRAVMGLLGFQMPWIAVVFVVVVGIIGNFLFGLDRRRRLLDQIKRATDAKEISR